MGDCESKGSSGGLLFVFEIVPCSFLEFCCKTSGVGPHVLDPTCLHPHQVLGSEKTWVAVALARELPK